MRMSPLLVVLMVLGTGVAHYTTTFLRLTALRSDQGVWTARFGQYEITIELRHHLAPGQLGDYNDTWTVKVKHTPKNLVHWDEQEVDDNELLGDIPEEEQPQESESKEVWNSSDNEGDTPILKKLEPTPRKSNKGKKRRQLSNKFTTTTTEKNDITQTESPDEESLSELVQGSTRINVVFDNEEDDTVTEEKSNSSETYGDDQWKNIAAIIYDGLPINSAPMNTSDDQGNDYDSDLGRLSEPYALPLQQSSQGYDYDAVDDLPLTQNTRTSDKSSAVTWGVPKEVLHDQARQTVRNASDANKQTESGYDYVVEDTSVNANDESDEDEENSYEESKKVDLSDLEATPEMKRLAQWYPRSTPLSTNNNGFKLFPGVGWFKLVPWAERWSNASRVCKLQGSHLAVPDTREKVKVFLQIFNNYPDVLEQSILSQQVYVGVYNNGGYHMDFHTVQDELFQPDFPIWFPGEPDNADPGEECVTFHKKGKIRDVPCFYNLPFLCEKPPDISS